jgi:hypothetical protein
MLLDIKCCWHVGLHTLMAVVCVTHVSSVYNKQRSASVHNGRSRRAVRWAYTSPPPPTPPPQPYSTHKFHQAVALRNYTRKFSARNSAGKLDLLFLVSISLSNHIQRHLVSQISPRLPSSSLSSIHNLVFSCILPFEIYRENFLYRWPGNRSCHSTSRRMQVFRMIKLPCSFRG